MKTYNVQLEDIIIPVDADACEVSLSGSLVFYAGNKEQGKVVRAFNENIWKEVWLVPENG